MKISKDLNLVVEVQQEEGPPLRVHSVPIPLSMYEDNALLIGQAMMEVYGSRITFQAAPRVLAPTLRRIAREQAERGSDYRPGMPTAYDGLLAEVHRGTLVLVPRDVTHEKSADGKTSTLAAGRYEAVPIDEAIKRDVLDDTDVSEVDGALLFFSAAWRFHGKADRRTIVTGAASLWSGFVTSSDSTAFAASLPTSTATETSGEKVSSSAPAQTVVETSPSGEKRTSSLPF